MLFRSKIFACRKFVQNKRGFIEVVENIEPKIGGASRDRTDDLIVANDALSQLSYSPILRNNSFNFTSANLISKASDTYDFRMF
jgi:hypothetical protein